MYEYLFILQSKLKADRWHRENRRLAARAFEQPSAAGKQSPRLASAPTRPLTDDISPRSQP